MGALRYGQVQGRGRNSPYLLGPQGHDRKTEPGDKVRIHPQALPEAQPAELRVEVPENYGGNFPLYLTKVSLAKVCLTTMAARPQALLASLPPVLLSLPALAYF